MVGVGGRGIRGEMGRIERVDCVETMVEIGTLDSDIKVDESSQLRTFDVHCIDELYDIE